MTALEIVPSDTIYIPKPAHLIVKGAQTAAATNKLVDSVLTPKIWQGTTDGAAAGVTGDIRFASDAIYVCVATNTWKKADIATF